MDNLTLLLFVLLPSLLVFAVVYFLLKQFFVREKKLREDELKLKARKDYIPLRIQAYERTVLYLERIDPNNLIMRIHRPGMSAKMLHGEILKAIREEYIHNMAQQLYISEKGWDLVKQAKEETVKIFNMAHNSMETDIASGVEFSKVVFDIVGRLEHLPSEQAIKYLRRDFQKGM